MHRHSITVWALGFMLGLVALTAGGAQAAAKKALYVTIAGDYNSFGELSYNELNTYVTAYHGAAGLVDYVLLDTNGEVAALLAANTYEQIWVYDLSYNRPDNYPTDYAAIAAWYNQSPVKEVICDGRFLGSFYSGREASEGRQLTQNYYYNLAVRGGGIVLATDHDIFAVTGINPLSALLGIGPFTGNFGGSFPLETAHPLTTEPNTLTSLSNDTSTGQAPFGLQPGGAHAAHHRLPLGQCSEPGHFDDHRWRCARHHRRDRRGRRCGLLGHPHLYGEHHSGLRVRAVHLRMACRQPRGRNRAELHFRLRCSARR